ARVTGATPNSSAFISVLRPRQARVQPAAPAAVASRDRPGTPRRGEAAGCANGPAAGEGSGAVEAGPGTAGAGSGAAGAGSGVAGGGGGGEEAPKLGGIPPGLTWSP